VYETGNALQRQGDASTLTESSRRAFANRRRSSSPAGKAVSARLLSIHDTSRGFPILNCLTAIRRPAPLAKQPRIPADTRPALMLRAFEPSNLGEPKNRLAKILSALSVGCRPASGNREVTPTSPRAPVFRLCLRRRPFPKTVEAKLRSRVDFRFAIGPCPCPTRP